MNAELIPLDEISADKAPAIYGCNVLDHYVDVARAEVTDTKHKAAINRAAMEAFIAGGMPEECAKMAVTLIAKARIPNVKISY